MMLDRSSTPAALRGDALGRALSHWVPRCRSDHTLLPVSDWVRLLSRASGVSGEWHAPRIKGISTTTHCGLTLEGPLEIAREDRAEREKRCATCATTLSPAKVLGEAVKKAAVKKAVAKKSMSRSTPKKKSSRAHR